MYLLVIFSFFAIAAIELLPLYREKKSKELKVYVFFFVLSFILFLLLTFDISVPSPAKAFKAIINLIIGV